MMQQGEAKGTGEVKGTSNYVAGVAAVEWLIDFLPLSAGRQRGQ